MEEQIKKMSSDCENNHVKDLTELKDEIQKITENIQVHTLLVIVKLSESE